MIPVHHKPFKFYINFLLGQLNFIFKPIWIQYAKFIFDSGLKAIFPFDSILNLNI